MSADELWKCHVYSHAVHLNLHCLTSKEFGHLRRALRGPFLTFPYEAPSHTRRHDRAPPIHHILHQYRHLAARNFDKRPFTHVYADTTPIDARPGYSEFAFYLLRLSPAVHVTHK
jgi:hypothetical protein